MSRGDTPFGYRIVDGKAVVNEKRRKFLKNIRELS